MGVLESVFRHCGIQFPPQDERLRVNVHGERLRDLQVPDRHGNIVRASVKLNRVRPVPQYFDDELALQKGIVGVIWAGLVEHLPKPGRDWRHWFRIALAALIVAGLVTGLFR